VAEAGFLAGLGGAGVAASEPVGPSQGLGVPEELGGARLGRSVPTADAATQASSGQVFSAATPLETVLLELDLERQEIQRSLDRQKRIEEQLAQLRRLPRPAGFSAGEEPALGGRLPGPPVSASAQNQLAGLLGLSAGGSR